MSKQGIKIKETDKTTIIVNAYDEELGCLDWKAGLPAAILDLPPFYPKNV